MCSSDLFGLERAGAQAERRAPGTRTGPAPELRVPAVCCGVILGGASTALTASGSARRTPPGRCLRRTEALSSRIERAATSRTPARARTRATETETTV